MGPSKCAALNLAGDSQGGVCSPFQHTGAKASLETNSMRKNRPWFCQVVGGAGCSCRHGDHILNV